MHAEAASAPADLPKTVKIVNFTDAGKRQDTVTVPRVVKTEDDWRKQLSPDSFEVTRHAGTERAYTNENPNNHEKGVFRCICCDTALFDAGTKFESGTGWPSFWAVSYTHLDVYKRQGLRMRVLPVKHNCHVLCVVSRKIG